VLEEAGTRIHGTTREQPLERFLIEKPLLQALPDIAPDLGSWNRVKLHRDCHVKFDHSLYSAPFTLVGQRLWLRATDTTVSIFQDYRLVAATCAAASTVSDALSLIICHHMRAPSSRATGAGVSSRHSASARTAPR